MGQSCSAHRRAAYKTCSNSPFHQEDAKLLSSRSEFKSLLLGEASQHIKIQLKERWVEEDFLELERVFQLMEGDLISLDLSNNQLGDTGAKAMADCLDKLPNLKQVNLSFNDIGDDGMKALAASTTISNKVHMLRVSHNHIGKVGASALSTALQQPASPRMTHLDLHCNKLGDGGAMELSRALEKSKSLHWIHIVANKIGNTGAKFLAQGLKNNNGKLHVLLLSHNRVRYDGAEALVQVLHDRAMDDNVGCKFLVLKDNWIGKWDTWISNKWGINKLQTKYFRGVNSFFAQNAKGKWEWSGFISKKLQQGNKVEDRSGSSDTTSVEGEMEEALAVA